MGPQAAASCAAPAAACMAVPASRFSARPPPAAARRPGRPASRRSVRTRRRAGRSCRARRRCAQRAGVPKLGLGLVASTAVMARCVRWLMGARIGVERSASLQHGVLHASATLGNATARAGTAMRARAATDLHALVQCGGPRVLCLTRVCAWASQAPGGQSQAPSAGDPPAPPVAFGMGAFAGGGGFGAIGAKLAPRAPAAESMGGSAPSSFNAAPGRNM